MHADNGRFSLTEERMDGISAGDVAVIATAEGSNIAIVRTNARSGNLVSFGTGVSISCCDRGSITSVSTTGGSSSIFTSRRSSLINVSFGVAINYSGVSN